MAEKTVIGYKIVSGFLGGPRIEFSADPDLTGLPEMTLRISDYGFPRPDDEKIATIGHVDLNRGKGTYTLSKDAAKAYRKCRNYGLFFADFSDYEVYTLDQRS